MISKNIKRLTTALAIISFVGACKKDILDIKPTQFVSDVAVFQDLTLTSQFVTNIYGNLLSGFDRRDAGLGNDWSAGMSLLATATDEAEGISTSSLNTLQQGDLNSQFVYGTEMWAINYQVIRKANTLLARIDAVPGDAALRNRLKAEGLFLRAFSYGELIKAFGGVPLITTEQSVNDDLFLPRSTFEEVLNQVVADCDAAAAVLPTTYPADQLGRATKGAALALKARMLLYHASPLHNPNNDLTRWQTAATAAKAVMDLNVYSLYPNYYRLFLDKAGNTEVIFAKKYARPSRTHETPWKLAMSIQVPDVLGGAWGGFSPTQNLVDAYEMKNGKPISDPTSGYNPQDPYANRDNRLDQSILRNGSQWKGITVETWEGGNAQRAANNDRTKTGYGLRKMIDDKYITGDQVYQGGDNDWIFIRYGEVLLNFAEAQNEATGPNAAVENAVNLLRTRGGLAPLSGLSQAQMRERIRNERRVELSFEEHRFWDVRRWKLGSTFFNVPVKRMRIVNNAGTFNYTVQDLENRVYKEHYNLLPIPQTEIDRNAKLIQNQGY